MAVGLSPVDLGARIFQPWWAAGGPSGHRHPPALLSSAPHQPACGVSVKGVMCDLNHCDLGLQRARLSLATGWAQLRVQ